MNSMSDMVWLIMIYIYIAYTGMIWDKILPLLLENAQMPSTMVFFIFIANIPYNGIKLTRLDNLYAGEVLCYYILQTERKVILLSQC